jgi:hypothetical protein
MKARIGYKEKPEYSTGKWLKYYFEKFTCKVTNQNRCLTDVEPDTTGVQQARSNSGAG